MNESTLEIRLDVTSTVVMAIAVILTAWCAYQASLWSGVSTFTLSDANSEGRNADYHYLRFQQKRLLDALMFTHYIDAKLNKNEEIERYYIQRFRPELKVAFQAWLKTKPDENLNAPAGPFVMSEYVIEDERLGQLAKDKVSAYVIKAQQANHHANMYVLSTVVLATVLFFSGLSRRLRITKSRIVILGIGIAILALVSIFILVLATLFGMP